MENRIAKESYMWIKRPDTGEIIPAYFDYEKYFSETKFVESIDLSSSSEKAAILSLDYNLKIDYRLKIYISKEDELVNQDFFIRFTNDNDVDYSKTKKNGYEKIDVDLYNGFPLISTNENYPSIKEYMRNIEPYLDKNYDSKILYHKSLPSDYDYNLDDFIGNLVKDVIETFKAGLEFFIDEELSSDDLDIISFRVFNEYIRKYDDYEYREEILEDLISYINSFLTKNVVLYLPNVDIESDETIFRLIIIAEKDVHPNEVTRLFYDHYINWLDDYCKSLYDEPNIIKSLFEDTNISYFSFKSSFNKTGILSLCNFPYNQCMEKGPFYMRLKDYTE